LLPASSASYEAANNSQTHSLCDALSFVGPQRRVGEWVGEWVTDNSSPMFDLLRHFEMDRLVPVLDRVLPLDRAAEALELLTHRAQFGEDGALAVKAR
jgi:hypothetical protein